MVDALLMRPTIAGWELRTGIESFAKTMGARVGKPVSITWDPIQTASIDVGGHIRLAAIDDAARVSRATLIRYVGFVLHEILHAAYTDWDVVGPVADYYERSMHNAIEDAWIERTGIEQGLTGNLGPVLSTLIDQIVGESGRTDWSDPACYPFVFAVHLRAHARRLVPVARGLEPLVAEAKQRLIQCASTQDTLALALWIIRQLRALPEQQQGEQQQGEQGEQGEQQQGEQGEQQEGGEGASGEQSSQQAEQQGESGQQGEPGESGAESGEQPGPARRPDQYTECDPVEPSIPASDTPGVYSSTASDIGEPGCHVGQNGVRSLSINVPASLRADVRRLFDNSARTEFHPGRLSGALNVRALHRQDGRLFQRREDVEGIDSAVVLAIDVSGSMQRLERIEHAANAAWALWSALDSAQVPVGMVTFGRIASIALPIGARGAAVRHVLERLVACGGTDDAAAIRLAMDMLLVRREQRRVLMILSDGRGRPDTARRLCESAQRLGIIVIGVGIQHDVSDVYPNTVLVKRPADLGKRLFSQIKIAA
jgi:Mg-chelatase subunit ChlD